MGSYGVNVICATPDVFDKALNLATDNQLQMWNALIITTSAHTGWTVGLSKLPKYPRENRINLREVVTVIE